MIMDETLYKIAEKISNFAVIYLVDTTETPDFNDMYELYDNCTLMFFYRNKHIMIDLGTGNNNKINWPIDNKQELIDIVETVYRGASKGPSVPPFNHTCLFSHTLLYPLGRGLVVSPRDYSTKHKY